jgi:hypothetical protein
MERAGGAPGGEEEPERVRLCGLWLCVRTYLEKRAIVHVSGRFTSAKGVMCELSTIRVGTAGVGHAETIDKIVLTVLRVWPLKHSLTFCCFGTNSPPSTEPCPRRPVALLIARLVFI